MRIGFRVIFTTGIAITMMLFAAAMGATTSAASEHHVAQSTDYEQCQKVIE
jgi:hypothetical protein